MSVPAIAILFVFGLLWLAGCVSTLRSASFEDGLPLWRKAFAVFVVFFIWPLFAFAIARRLP